MMKEAAGAVVDVTGCHSNKLSTTPSFCTPEKKKGTGVRKRPHGCGVGSEDRTTKVGYILRRRAPEYYYTSAKH